MGSLNIVAQVASLFALLLLGVIVAQEVHHSFFACVMHSSISVLDRSMSTDYESILFHMIS